MRQYYCNIFTTCRCHCTLPGTIPQNWAESVL